MRERSVDRPVWSWRWIGLAVVGCVLSLPLALGPLARLASVLLRPLWGREGGLALRQLLRHWTRTALTAGVLCVAVLLSTYVAASLAGYHAGLAAGLLSGAATSSGVLGVATDTRSQGAAFAAVGAWLATHSFDIIHGHAFDAPAFDCVRGANVIHTLHLPPIDDRIVVAARGAGATLATVSESCQAAWDRAGKIATQAQWQGYVAAAAAAAAHPIRVRLSAG